MQTLNITEFLFKTHVSMKWIAQKKYKQALTLDHKKNRIKDQTYIKIV